MNTPNQDITAADLLRYQASVLVKQAEVELKSVLDEGRRTLSALHKSAGADTGLLQAGRQFLMKAAGVNRSVPYGEEIEEICRSLDDLTTAPVPLAKVAEAAPAVAAPAAAPVVAVQAGGADEELLKAAEEDVCRRLLAGEIDRERAQAALAGLRAHRGAA